MAFCSECGQQLVDGAKFCYNCGSAVNSTNTQGKRKTKYDGEIHKCPNCGETLESFVTICPTCGYELRGTSGNGCVTEFAHKLEKTNSIEQKIELIKNFHIPNTKEDIYEFFILAISNINSGGYGIDAWSAKLDQAFHKGQLTFGNTTDFQQIKRLYKKVSRKRIVKSIFNTLKQSSLAKCVILCSIGILMIIVGWFAGSESSDSDSPWYMLALLGMYPILGGVSIFGKSKKDDNDDEK